MSIMATGGGAYKYYDEMRRVLGVEILREDEMDCLIIGMSGQNRNIIKDQRLRSYLLSRP